MNRNVYKVIYYKNGKALKYWYENHNISITNATIGDSGTYYCGGILWQINYTSDPVNITVKKGESVKKRKLVKEGAHSGGRERRHEVVASCRTGTAVIPWNVYETCNGEIWVIRSTFFNLCLEFFLKKILMAIVIPAHITEFL